MWKHAFPVQGTLSRCWLFAFRAPADRIRQELPPELEPLEQGGFGFWSLVVCQLHWMRPAGLPAALGTGYHHVAYRIYARCTPEQGEPVPGIYFVRSECDQRWMQAAGNWLTDFRFLLSPIAIRQEGPSCEIQVRSSDGLLQAELDLDAPPTLSNNSPFPSIEAAEAFLKYHPCGLFVRHPGLVHLLPITRDENAWRSRPVAVRRLVCPFLERREATLELACTVEPIQYRWNPAHAVPVRRRLPGA